MAEPCRVKVSRWDHPYGLIVMAVLLMLASLVEALDYRDALTQVVRSLLLGFVLGMPATIYWKRSIRRHMDMHVQAALRPMPAGMKRPYLRESVRLGILLFLSYPTFLLVSELLSIPNRSGLWMLYILFALTYPEQKAVWLAAKARVTEMERSQHQEPVDE